MKDGERGKYFWRYYNAPGIVLNPPTTANVVAVRMLTEEPKA